MLSQVHLQEETKKTTEEKKKKVDYIYKSGDAALSARLNEKKHHSSHKDRRQEKGKSIKPESLLEVPRER